MNTLKSHQLLSSWVQEISMVHDDYSEPILDELSTEIVKHACDTLNQDIHVFIMSIEIAERYFKLKLSNSNDIPDPILTVCTAIFISNKHVGAVVTIKLKQITEYLNKITGKPYGKSKVKHEEVRILAAIENLPLFTKVDDVSTLASKVVADYNLSAPIQPLAMETLKALYVNRKHWFEELKGFYTKSPDSLKMFQSLICSKLFLPIGIIVTCFELTKYKNFFNMQGLIEDLSAESKIQSQHIILLSNIIIKLTRNLLHRV